MNLGTPALSRWSPDVAILTSCRPIDPCTSSTVYVYMLHGLTWPVAVFAVPPHRDLLTMYGCIGGFILPLVLLVPFPVMCDPICISYIQLV